MLAAHDAQMDLRRILAEELAAAAERIEHRVVTELLGGAAVVTAAPPTRPKRSGRASAAPKTTTRGKRRQGRKLGVDEVKAMHAKVLSLFRPGKPLTAGDVIAGAKLERHRATRALNALVDAKKVRATGNGFGRRYTLAK